MEEPEKVRPGNGEPIGESLAAEMLKNLVRLNDNIEKSHAIQANMAESLASLVDYHETWMRAAEMMIESADEGKSKFSTKDLVLALAEAAVEVMGESGEEEDESGPEDPRVSARR